MPRRKSSKETGTSVPSRMWYTFTHPMSDQPGFVILMVAILWIVFVCALLLGSREFEVYFLPVLFVMLIGLALFLKAGRTKSKP